MPSHCISSQPPRKSELPHRQPEGNEGSAGNRTRSWANNFLRLARQIVSHHDVLFRYSLAVLAVLAATGLRFAFARALGEYVPYWSFSCAVLVVGWIAGRGPAVATTALSALAVYWFFLPRQHTFFIADPAAAVGLALFVVTVAPLGLMVGSFQDSLLARAKAEETVRQSEARLQFVLYATALGAWDFDVASHRVWRSPHHDEIFGYQAPVPEWTYEMFLSRHVLAEDRESVEREVKRATTTGDLEFECRVRRADGAVRWIWAKGKTQFDEQGRPVRMLGLTQDITDRKTAEEALRESESRFQFVLDAAKLAAWELDLVHDRKWTAAHYDEIFGYSTPQQWSYEKFLGHVLPEDRQELDRKLREVAASGGDWQYEFRIRRADGVVRWVLTRGRSLSPGGPMYGVEQDITEAKEAEEHLRHAQKLESIGLLAGGVAHDFNNLLTVIMGNADCARMEHPDSKNIQQILGASERAAHLTRQLLAYAGKGQFVTERFNLSGLVSRSTALLSDSIPKGVRLEFNAPTKELLIEADPSQIEQILMNLVINAAEAIPPQTDGRIEISTNSCELTPEMVHRCVEGFDCEPGRFVCLEITDNGTGMDESTLAKIFNPFFSTRFTGRGLGLAAVQGIVRSCRGFIEVQSSPGAGSTFRVFLPALKGDLPQNSRLSPRSGQGASTPDHSEDGRRRDVAQKAAYGPEALRGHR